MANLSNINDFFVVQETTGYVGIGTNAPASYRLVVENTAEDILKLHNSTDGLDSLITFTNPGGTLARIQGVDNGGLQLDTGNNAGGLNTNALLIDNAGNIGMGISPTEKLDILKTSGTTNIRVYDSSSNSEVGLKLQNDAKTWQLQNWGSGGDNLRILNNAGTTIQIWDDNENVGIGIANDPAAKLAIGSGVAKTSTGTEEVLYLGQSNEASNYSVLQVYTKGGAAQADRSVSFQTIETGVANAGSIVLQPSGGNVGIGTTSPEKKLHIYDSTQGNQSVRFGNPSATPYGEINYDSSGFEHLYIISKGTTTGYGNIVFQTGGTPSEAMRITSAGELTQGPNVNSTTPNTALLRLANTSVYGGGGAGPYGNYGAIIFNASTHYTGGAKRYMITNQYLGNCLAFIRSSNATTDPAVSGNSATVSSGSVSYYINSSGQNIFPEYVGIGTDSPAALLEISGTGDAIRVESTNTGSGGAQVDLLHFTTSPADNDIFGLINMGGYYTGTSSVYGASIRGVWADVAARDAQLEFWTNNSGTLDKAVTIKSDGEVGIGTGNPSYGLDVVKGTEVQARFVGSSTGHTQGAIVLSSGTADTPSARGQGVFRFNEGNDTTWYTGTAYSAADTYIWARQGSTTTLDTGTATTPHALMTLTNTGTLTTESSISAQGMITVTQNDIGTGESVGLRIIRSGGAQVWNITSGITGIDNTTFNVRNSTSNTNVFSIDASSNAATCAGDVVAYSDKKLKKNIKTLDGSKVYEMRGVSFDRIDTDKASSGVIAQEIQKIAPELISESNETLGVAYGNLTGYLIEAIKDLKAEIEELKNKPCACNNCNCNK